VKNLRLFLFFSFIAPISLITETWAFDSAEYFNNPQREFSIILTDDGYFPNSIVAFEGEKIKFFLTSTIDKPECLIVKDHKIFLEARKGKITKGESVFKRAGKYEFYCPSSKYKGLITILKKNEKEKESISILPTREVASDRPSYWTPRDYDQ